MSTTTPLKVSWRLIDDRFGGIGFGSISMLPNSSVPFASGNSDYQRFIGVIGKYLDSTFDDTKTYEYLGIDDYLSNSEYLLYGDQSNVSVILKIQDGTTKIIDPSNQDDVNEL